MHLGMALQGPSSGSTSSCVARGTSLTSKPCFSFLPNDLFFWLQKKCAQFAITLCGCGEVVRPWSTSLLGCHGAALQAFPQHMMCSSVLFFQSFSVWPNLDLQALQAEFLRPHWSASALDKKTWALKGFGTWRRSMFKGLGTYSPMQLQADAHPKRLAWEPSCRVHRSWRVSETFAKDLPRFVLDIGH